MSLPPPIAAALTARFGLNLDVLGDGTLDAAWDRHCRSLPGLTEGRLVADLLETPKALSDFAEDIFVPESWFFRDAEPFRFLAQWLTRRSASGVKLRLASIPCAAGQEAYSLAMCAADAGIPPQSVDVLGVDASARQLARAAEGIYGRGSFRDETWREHALHFREMGSGCLEVSPTIRSSVSFRQANLAEPGALADCGDFDAIFCRNLLIYLTEEARDKVTALLNRLLLPGGLLVLGHADPLPPRLQLERIGPRAAFAYVRGGHIQASGSGLQLPSFATKPVRRPVPESPPTVSPPPEKPPQEIASALDFARSLADAGRLDEAEAYLRPHLERAHSPDLWLFMSRLFSALGRPDAAEDACRKALYLAPNHAEALLAQALFCERRGDSKRAAHLRQRALRAGNAP